ncbi:hypothetical protein K4K52_007133 [Colletotrichum sp. SAR 10_76]|nr:hypothetical protein K4K52_007133 [Colletotrichum sp. SAR 10_76]
MQWMYPCGGLNVTQNRTHWPLEGGAIAVQPGYNSGHQSALMYVNIGLGEVPSNFTTVMVPMFHLTGPTNDAYDGTVCLPHVPLPRSVEPREGDLATIQVVQAARHGGALFSCVDIIFTGDESKIASVNDSNCFNSSGLNIQAANWTPDYVDFQAKAIDWPYSPTTLYEKWEHFSREKAGCTDEDTPTPDRFVWGDYETISYTWENGSNNKYTIYVNDRPFIIQENLYHALQEFWKSEGFVEGRKRMLWADAICINQNDLEERAAEVKRMNEIFGTAKKSTVWLGPSLELKGLETQAYFDLIDRLIDNLPLEFADDSSTDDTQPTSAELASSKAGTPDEDDQEDQESRQLSEEALAMLSQFDPAERPPTSIIPTLSANERLLALLFPILRLDYWNRVWIIQELAISSSETVVRVGSSQISFARLSWFAERFVNAATFDPNWSPDDEYTRTFMNTLLLLRTIYDIQLQVDPDEWETSPEYILIMQGLMSRSSLPLDKLYGMLGLLQPATYLGIDVDYKKTIRQADILVWLLNL